MADMRKQLSKLKVVELKEKLQELGKTPKGLKADLVNQLAEAYEEQNEGMADQSAPMQGYPPAPMANAPDSAYYQQPVGQFPLPAPQVYSQSQPYLQTPYEQQYQYSAHQVFSQPHEQQYNESPTQYPIAAQLSPRIASQMSPQLSPQMTNQLAPPIQPQITQQLSPQMAAQHYRPAEFQSPHRAFQPNESEYHSEYGPQTAADQLSHYGLPHGHSHMEMQSMSSPQPAMPPTHTHASHPSAQLVHRPQVMDEYGSDLAQTQPVNQNIAPDLSAYKQESEPFIATHPEMVPNSAPTDMIDFDDVGIVMDPANEVPYNQQMGAFETDQGQGEFDFQRDASDGQRFSQVNPISEMSVNDDTNETNEGTNEESTDVDSNESNQSYSNDAAVGDQVKDVGSAFQEQPSQEVPSEQSIAQIDPIPSDVNKMEEESAESAQTDVDSSEESQSTQDSQSQNNAIDLTDCQTNEAIDDVVQKESKLEDKEQQEVQKSCETQPKALSTTIEVAKEEVKQEPEPELEVSSVLQNGIISDKKLTKNQKKKQRKKMRANRRQLEQQKQQSQEKPKTEENDKMDIDDEDQEDQVEIEYVPESIQKDPIYFQYLKVFDKFRTGERTKNDDEEVYVDPVKKMQERKRPVELDLKDDEEKKDGEQKISKRKMKQMTRMSIAELKQRVNHPELVEMHDVTAKDPLLLLHLKATRNSVPVPRHWCYKRKYLQGKRGFEKPPFKLPEFIRRTGIMEMRQALQEKEESKSLKAQMREKIRPKMGKIDIDYQKLHDAFFKWQTKPKMTIHGDLYYEGKEFETRLKEKRPGELSTELRTALGMPTGPNAHKCPPPWLIAMQRYGPPPSYPNIKIPGLNAPIPDGCSFGYHAGGWGKPPVDEYGRPLYGDVFGTASTSDQKFVEEEVDRTLWGEMEDESEEEEESSEEEEEPEAAAAPGKAPTKEVDESGFVTPAEGLITPSGLTSLPTGLETPDLIELRKRKQIEAEMESGDNPSLYTVIPEKRVDKFGRETMASAHTYDMSAATLRKGHGVDVALDPSDLEAGALDSAAVAARYEQTMKEQSSHLSKGEDLSDMVAEHAARQKRKKQMDTNKSTKKYQFKF